VRAFLCNPGSEPALADELARAAPNRAIETLAPGVVTSSNAADDEAQVGDPVFADELEGNDAVHQAMAGLEDLPHATGPDLWKGLALAEERRRESAAERGVTVAEYRKILQQRYKDAQSALQDRSAEQEK